MQTLSLRTTKRTQILDITAQVQGIATKEKWREGLLVIYCPHTTAAISINENADPDVKTDMNDFLQKLVPQKSDFTHAEGNSDGHIKSSLVGCSQTLIVEGGELKLGTWQGIYFMEFDGPREREVWVKFVGR